MNETIKWLEVAKDEIETLINYSVKFAEIQGDKGRLEEIMGDEVNHALIALFTATSLLELSVPTDGLDEAMQGVNFKEEGDEAV